MSNVLSKILGFFTGEGFKRYLKSLKYSLYMILHPFDGSWDLIHEKRGSMAAAHTIVILALLTNIWDMRFSNFMVNNTRWSEVNILMRLASILVPLFIWVLSNWCLTTLFDGKGRFGDIYMATAYSFTPYVLIGIPMIIVSNIVTKEEGVFYTYFNVFALIWCVFLILCAMMMIHDYGLGGGLLSTLASVAGMAVIMFIVLLFFSLISDAVAYFVSIYKEITMRIS